MRVTPATYRMASLNKIDLSFTFSRILVCKTKHHATVRQTTDAQDLLVVQLQIEAEQTFYKDI